MPGAGGADPGPGATRAVGATSVFDEPVALERLLGVPTLSGGPTLEPVLDLKTGGIVGHEEVCVDPAAAPGTATTSSSLQRDPAPPADWVRGQNTFRPFTPAGPADEVLEATAAAASLAAEWAAGGDDAVAAQQPSERREPPCALPLSPALRTLTHAHETCGRTNRFAGS